MIDVNLANVADIRKVQKEIESMVKELTGPQAVVAMRESTLMIERTAKQLAPVDTGRLRASITPSVTVSENKIEGVVGSNVKYAPCMEFGTRPHKPPIAAIMGWVHRKKMAGTYSVRTRRRTGGKTRQRSEDYIVAKWVVKAIGTRGLAAREYLKGAFDKNLPRIQQRFDVLVMRIIKQ